MAGSKLFSASCPAPMPAGRHVQLAHGGGGRLMHQLLEQFVLPRFQSPLLASRHDGAVMDVGGMRLAFTTDSYVVKPLFFSGGDIGTLAVNGTVNDLAMCGARPLYLSAGFILEEGLEFDTLRRVIDSMQRSATAAGVQFVTGDTKVVDNGKGDGIFVNTAGIGIVEHSLAIAPASVIAGDAILLSGDVGRHGIAILAAREGLELETAVASDCAPVAEPVLAMIADGIEVHCLRDLTRGGLATSLVEIAEAAAMNFVVQETAISVEENVQGACEILGFDPLYVANEGRFVAFVAAHDARRALEVLRSHPVSANAAQIGRVQSGPPGLVTLESRIGTRRILDMLAGDQLPRIC